MSLERDECPWSMLWPLLTPIWYMSDLGISAKLRGIDRASWILMTCSHMCPCLWSIKDCKESIWINVYCLWYYLDLPSMLMPVSCEIWGMNKWTWWDDNSTPRIILPFRQAECPKQISWLGGLVHKSHRLVHQQFWIDDKSFFDEWGPGVCEISSNLQPKLNDIKCNIDIASRHCTVKGNHSNLASETWTSQPSTGFNIIFGSTLTREWDSRHEA